MAMAPSFISGEKNRYHAVYIIDLGFANLVYDKQLSRRTCLLSKMILLPHTHAKVDQNDSSPLVGMNFAGEYYSGMSHTRDVEFYFTSY
jgi:hypothetical protein